MKLDERAAGREEEEEEEEELQMGGGRGLWSWLLSSPHLPAFLYTIYTWKRKRERQRDRQGKRERIATTTTNAENNSNNNNNTHTHTHTYTHTHTELHTCCRTSDIPVIIQLLNIFSTFLLDFSFKIGNFDADWRTQKGRYSIIIIINYNNFVVFFFGGAFFSFWLLKFEVEQQQHAEQTHTGWGVGWGGEK